MMTQSTDILNVVEGLPKRIQVLPAMEPPPNKKLVAKTNCEIRFKDEANLQACIKALKESDEQMRLVPSAQVMYQWNIVFREGMKILFGVLWFDRDFFERRKDAFRSAQHGSIFQRFGVTADDFTVEHEVIQ